MPALSTLGVGFAIAKLLLRITAGSAVADAIDGSAEVARLLRGLLEQKQGPRTVAYQVAQSLDLYLDHEFPLAQPNDRKAAIDNVTDLLELAASPRLIIDSVIDPVRLRDSLLEHGGMQRSRSLGGDAGRIFEALLEASVDAVARWAPGSTGFSSAATTHLLRVSDQILLQADRTLAAMTSVEEGLAAIADRVWLNPEASVETALYKHEIHSYAPPLLLGRTKELAELERFSVSGPESWRGYRAPAKSGKTALMATLALNPPQGVRVVAFFVRQFQYDSNSRSAFLERILPRLAQIAGESSASIPSSPVRSMNEFRRLLSAASLACRRKVPSEQILVLIDGLDEDVYLDEQGRREGSIAGLLPAELPGNVRVLLACRPNPPIPRDVVDLDSRRQGHPLRDEAIWRDLSSSSHAMAAFSRQEIIDFMSSPAGESVGAYLAAAGGPLTEKDLTNLAKLAHPELRLADIHRVIVNSSGRMLTPVRTPDGEEFQAEAYILGHNLIVQEVIGLLDDDLDGANMPHEDNRLAWSDIADRALEPWRDRIVDWADGLAKKGWQGDVPSYLLSDAYISLLTVDPRRIHALTQTLTSTRRIDKVIQRHGAHYPAKLQISQAVFTILERTGLRGAGGMSEDELFTVGSLTLKLGSLSHLGVWVPSLLPSVFAQLGRPRLATNLAHSITNPEIQEQALHNLAVTFAEMGQPKHALSMPQLMRNAEAQVKALNQMAPALMNDSFPGYAIAAAQGIISSWHRAKTLASVARVLAVAGHLTEANRAADLATATAQTLTDPPVDSSAVADIAVALAECGRPAAALAAAESISASWVRSPTMNELALAFARSHHPEDALAAALSTMDQSRAESLVRVAGALELSGDENQARIASEEALIAAGSDGWRWDRDKTLEEVALMWARSGHADRAVDAACAISEAEQRVVVVVKVASALALPDDSERARSAAAESLSLIEQVANPPLQRRVRKEAALTWARSGHPDEAVAAVWGIDETQHRAEAMAKVAGALALSGHAELARSTAVEALALIEQITYPPLQGLVRNEAALAFARSGHPDEAVAAVWGIDETQHRAEAMAKVAGALALSGHAEQARSAAVEALAWVEQITYPPLQRLVRNEAALAFARSGHPDEAVAAAALTDPWGREPEAVAEALARSGHSDQAVAAAELVAQPWKRRQVREAVTIALAQSGHPDEAIAAALVIDETQQRAETLAKVAGALARSGYACQARTVTDEALAAAKSIAEGSSRAETGRMALAAPRADLLDQDFGQEWDGTSVFAKAQALTEIASVFADHVSLADALVVANQARVAAEAVDAPSLTAQTLAQLGAALAYSGQPHDAVTAALSMPTPASQTAALASVVAAMAVSGYSDEAIAAAERISDPGQRGRIVEEAVLALARAGHPADAVAAALDISEERYRAQVLAKVAGVLALSGDVDEARTAGAEALAAAHAPRCADLMIGIQADVAVALARCGDPEDAAATALAIAEPKQQSRALAGVALALAQSNNPFQAVDIARSITDPQQQSRALAEVALALVQSNHPDRAVDIAGSNTDLRQKAQTLADVAVALARAGHTGLALTATKAAHHAAGNIFPWLRAQPLATLATAYVYRGDLDESVATAEAIGDRYFQAKALALVAHAAAETGYGDRACLVAEDALEKASRIPDPQLREAAMRDVAVALGRSGRPDLASACAQRIATPSLRIQALTETALAIAEFGDSDSAITAAQSVPDLAHSSSALARVAVALAQSGRPDCSIDAARAIADPKGEAQTLAEVAVVLEATGHCDLARWCLGACWSAAETPLVHWSVLTRLEEDVARRLVPSLQLLADEIGTAARIGDT